MPKKLPDDIEEKVLTHVGNSPEGLGIEALSVLLGDRISGRRPAPGYRFSRPVH